MSCDTDLAYIAGLFDGEGCISLSEVVDRGNGGGFRCMVQISMVDREGLDLLAKHFGGKLHLYSRDGAQPAYQWWVCNRKKVEEVLTALLPFLRVKTTHALVMLEFIRKFPGRQGSPASDANLGRMRVYVRLLGTLNSKGAGAEIVRAKLKEVL